MKTYRIEYENGGILHETVKGEDLFRLVPSGYSPIHRSSKFFKDKPHQVYQHKNGTTLVVYETN